MSVKIAVLIQTVALHLYFPPQHLPEQHGPPAGHTTINSSCRGGREGGKGIFSNHAYSAVVHQRGYSCVPVSGTTNNIIITSRHMSHNDVRIIREATQIRHNRVSPTTHIEHNRATIVSHQQSSLSTCVTFPQFGHDLGLWCIR